MPGDLPQHTILESIGHETRGTTVVTVANLETARGENNRLPLADLIDQLQDAMDVIPLKYRKTAVLNIDAYGEYVSVYCDIRFLRPETDAELADRRRWLDSIDQESEERDRAEFERLKAKYG